MLDGLRIMSKNIFGRAILAAFAGLIVVGFGFFGIRDVFTNFRANQLATVGAEEISAAQFRNEYQAELQRAQRQSRRAITNEEARAIGIDRQVLSRLLSGAALDQAGKKLGLAVSDAEIARNIRKNKAFSGLNGAFDQNRLNEILRENGYTENAYVREERLGALRQQIIAAVNGGFQAPQVLLSAVNTFANETRKADYFVLPAPDASTAAAPSDEDVAKYYDLRKDAYRTPEYRKVTVLNVLPDDVAKTIEISDETAKKLYDQNVDKLYSAPEKRVIAQLTFASQEQAEKAAQRIKAGESFDAVAGDKEAGGVLADLGATVKAAIFDKAIGEAAFALTQPGVTPPTQGKFGIVLADVKKIEPGATVPFAEAKDAIKAAQAKIQARGEVQKLHDKIEDLRSQGKPLAEAASTLSLQVATYETDASGALKGENGKPGAPIPALAAAPELLKAIFASDVGVDNDSVSRKDGGFSWFEIGAIEPSHQLSLDEVKPTVLQSMREATVQKDLAAKANELARKIDAGASLAEVAAANGAQPQQANDVKRTGGAGLSSATTAQIFGTPVGGAGVAIADNGGRAVYKVTAAATPPLDPKSPALAEMLPKLQSAASDDLTTEFIAGLQAQLGTRINQTALRAAIGSDQ
jgi:peptidyl-prolyl cis-trans isomerase D